MHSLSGAEEEIEFELSLRKLPGGWQPRAEDEDGSTLAKHPRGVWQNVCLVGRALLNLARARCNTSGGEQNGQNIESPIFPWIRCHWCLEPWLRSPSPKRRPSRP